MKQIKKLLSFFQTKDTKTVESDVAIQKEETNINHNIQELNDYIEWRNRLKLGSIDDDTFLQILNARF